MKNVGEFFIYSKNYGNQTQEVINQYSRGEIAQASDKLVDVLTFSEKIPLEYFPFFGEFEQEVKLLNQLKQVIKGELKKGLRKKAMIKLLKYPLDKDLYKSDLSGIKEIRDFVKAGKSLNFYNFLRKKGIFQPDQNRLLLLLLKEKLLSEVMKWVLIDEDLNFILEFIEKQNSLFAEAKNLIFKISKEINFQDEVDLVESEINNIDFRNTTSERISEKIDFLLESVNNLIEKNQFTTPEDIYELSSSISLQIEDLDLIRLTNGMDEGEILDRSVKIFRGIDYLYKEVESQVLENSPLHLFEQPNDLTKRKLNFIYKLIFNNQIDKAFQKLSGYLKNKKDKEVVKKSHEKYLKAFEDFKKLEKIQTRKSLKTVFNSILSSVNLLLFYVESLKLQSNQSTTLNLNFGKKALQKDLGFEDILNFIAFNKQAELINYLEKRNFDVFTNEKILNLKVDYKRYSEDMFFSNKSTKLLTSRLDSISKEILNLAQKLNE